MVLRSAANSLRNYLSPQKIEGRYDPNTVVAAYYEPSGRVRPITAKTMMGWSNGEYNALAASANNRSNAPASLQGFAYLSEVNVWIRRCIEIRAQNIARLEWYVEDKTTGKRIPDHPLIVAINRARHYMERYSRSQDIWGEVYTKPMLNRHGYYSDLWWINNLSISFTIVNGQIVQYYFVPLHGGKAYTWGPTEVCYIWNENAFDDLHGSSRILSVLHEANVHEEIARAAQAHFANDARPGLMFLPETDMGVPQSQAFIDYWKANFQGSLNTNKPVILPSAIKSVQVLERASLKDDVELRGTIRREICAAFGVPLSVAGAWDDANYQSAPEQRKSLYEETIIPMADEIAKDMSMSLMPFFEDTYRFKLWYDAKKLLALAEDKQQKSTALITQLTSGGLTLNQYRMAMDLEEIPQGNVFYVPNTVTVTPLEKMGTMPPPTPNGGGFGGMNPTPPQLPAPPQAAALPEPAKAAGSMAMLLSCANNPDLIGLQKRLKELFPDPGMQWIDPSTFHITLVYVPAFDEGLTPNLTTYAQSYSPPPMDLSVGSLASFDNVGEHALHFRIARNAALMDCQEELHAACESLGLPMSAYSTPSQFKPHITMGYSPERIPITRYQGNLRVSPDALEVSVETDGKYNVVHRSGIAYTQPNPPMPIQSPTQMSDNTEMDIPIATAAKGETIATPPQDIAGEVELAESTAPIEPEPLPALKDHDTLLLEELADYEKFTLNRWGKPLRAFTFNVVAPEMAHDIMQQVAACKTKSDVKALFEGYRVTFKAAPNPDIVTPEQAQEWWGEYDRLLKTLGNDWLKDYMREVWRKLEGRLSRDITPEDVQVLLEEFHPQLVEQWTGTVDEPGVIAKLFMAGMGAGQAALERKRVNLNPAKAVNLDWELKPTDAINAVNKYVGKLIKRIDKTTLEDVQTKLSQWLESGGTVADLAEQLNPIFNDTARSHIIAATESSNAYNNGAIERWTDAGVEKAKWKTTMDANVCNICLPLAGQVASLDEGWYSDVLGEYVWPPSHVSCRCWSSPVLE